MGNRAVRRKWATMGHDTVGNGGARHSGQPWGTTRTGNHGGLPLPVWRVGACSKHHGFRTTVPHVVDNRRRDHLDRIDFWTPCTRPKRGTFACVSQHCRESYPVMHFVFARIPQMWVGGIAVLDVGSSCEGCLIRKPSISACPSRCRCRVKNNRHEDFECLRMARIRVFRCRWDRCGLAGGDEKFVGGAICVAGRIFFD